MVEEVYVGGDLSHEGIPTMNQFSPCWEYSLYERSTESNVLHTLKTTALVLTEMVQYGTCLQQVSGSVCQYIYIYIYSSFLSGSFASISLPPYTQHYFLLIILFKFIMFIFPCQKQLIFFLPQCQFLLMNCYSQNYSRSAPQKIVSIQFSIWSTQKSINMF